MGRELPEANHLQVHATIKNTVYTKSARLLRCLTHSEALGQVKKSRIGDPAEALPVTFAAHTSSFSSNSVFFAPLMSCLRRRHFNSSVSNDCHSRVDLPVVLEANVWLET